MENLTVVQVLSSVVFSLMGLFYIARTFYSKSVISCCGYYSPQQELSHFLCAIGMLAMSAPLLTFIPSWVWVGVFSGLTALALSSLFFATKGQKPSRLWLGMHVGIYAGMTYMFFGGGNVFLTWIFATFYGSVVLFFLRELKESAMIQPFAPLSVGVDAFHILMAGSMILMFLWPEVYMPHMPESSMCRPSDAIDHATMHH